VIAAYRLVREEISELQLALVGSMALDDPEGWEVYGQVSEHAEDDPAIHLYTNLTGVGNVEVNAAAAVADGGAQAAGDALTAASRAHAGERLGMSAVARARERAPRGCQPPAATGPASARRARSGVAVAGGEVGRETLGGDLARRRPQWLV
jgi:hypothetical protein